MIASKGMRSNSIFHLISDISKKADISAVLIGGFAVNYYKVTRQTVDVDFLIAESDFKKIAPLLKEAGYEEDYLQKVFVRLRDTGKYLMDIDFMFVDKETLDRIVKDGKKIEIARREFTVPSLNNLIALKLHALKYNLKIRENKDVPDIVNLIIKNKVDYKKKSFREMCLKYGTEEIYRKIVERI